MAHQNVCRYFKFGYCKFLERCRLLHISEICLDSACDIKTCKLRHPRKCKYFRDYNRCKYGEWCYFSHEVKEDPSKEILVKIESDFNEKYEVIKSKLEKIDEKIEALEKEELDISKRLENIFVNKIETLENQIESLRKCLAEKDAYIETFEVRLKHIEEKLSESENIETNIVEETEKPEEVKFKCDKCSFETTSERGLKIHTQRKHTKFESEKFPKFCELCEETFTTNREFRKHMKTHSYKFVSSSGVYKCEECEFVSRSRYTMDVHEGKCRKEDFECGLCESKFENLENLDLHLVTCEVYQCGENECKLRAKTIKEIRNHLQEIHGYPMEVMHLKIDRNDPSEIDSKWHWSGNI